ncbi:MAG: flippase-like domain-containing protein, partial [Saprospiraceae bacterium]|nr:flippase-like domain-containing protein [Saprospiraceae bacterium]
IVSFYYILKNQDLGEIWFKIKEVKVYWILLVLLASVAGHLSRTHRWVMLIRANGTPVKFINAFFALMSGYFVNLGIPRAGEFTRCGALVKTDKVKFSTSFGTVLVERIVDMFCLFSIIGLTILTQQNHIGIFLQEYIYPWFSSITNSAKANPIKWIAGGALILLLLNSLGKKLEKPESKAGKKLDEIYDEFIEGLKSVIKTGHPALFIGHSIFIWVSYFLTSYLVFFTLTDSQSLSLGAGLSAMAFGSIAKMIPGVAGSAGPFHIIISAVLVNYGLNETAALTIATLIHGIQTMYYIALGGASTLALTFIQKRNQKD